MAKIIRRKSMAVVLALAMVVSLLPAMTLPASAADTTCTVTSTEAIGAGTLYDAMTQAKDTSGNITITFAPSLAGATITLDRDLPDLGSSSVNFTLEGLTGADGKPNITINGGGNVGISAAGSGDFTVRNIVFTGFSFKGADALGAAISTSDAHYKNTILSNCVFSDNTASAPAKAAVVRLTTNSASNTITVDRCIFKNNEVTSSDDGSYPMSAALSLSGKATITNSLFSGNQHTADYSSGADGCAIIVREDGDYEYNVNVWSNTFYGNSITNSGDVEGAVVSHEGSSGTLSIYNNIMLGNTATSVTTVTGIEKYIYSCAATISVDSGDSNVIDGMATDDIFTDAPNDFTLKSTATAAIDQGLPGYPSGSYDLAGNPRILGDAIDIGAYESSPMTITPASALTEENLDTNSLTVTLLGTEFSNSDLAASNFTLNSTLTGLTVESVTYTDPTHCTVNLAYNSSDFDTDETVSLTIKAAELTSGSDLTSGTLTITATDETAPTVTTQDVSDITSTTATGNGNITALGSANPTAYGVCWNTAGTPTTSDSRTDEGGISSTGAFTSSITGLTAGTTYHVRAYATNTAGTSYGDTVSFTTSALYWKDYAATAYAGGNGTSASPYLISTEAQLAYFSNQVNAGTSYNGKYFKLTADISLSGKLWTPIGNSEGTDEKYRPFDGIFDGDGHVVTSMNATVSASGSDLLLAGLFGFVDFDGVIKNLGVTGTAAADMTGSAEYATAGGLVADSYGAITNCYSRVTVTSSSTNQTAFAGGLVGGCLGTINNCYATGNISCTGSTGAYAGVLIGNCSGATVGNTYYNSDAAVTVNSSSTATVGDGSGSVTTTSMTSAQMHEAAFVTTLNANKGDGNNSWTAVTDGYPTFAATSATAPTVTTQAVSDITSTTATGNGNITALGSANPTAYGVCWNTVGTPITSDSKVDKGAASATGAFTASMTGLTAGTTYYVRAFATNTAGTSYGAQVSFTASATAPTVTTQAVSDITSTTATGNGNITALGSANPTAYGVCWNTVGTPTTSDSKVDKGAASATGAFTASMTGLTAGTTYYVRTFATNTAGTSYGAQVSFTTSATAPTVTTQAVSDITSTTATGNGNITALGSANPTAYGVCWNTVGTPTTSDSNFDKGAASATGAFTASMTGLTAGTTYYVRAFATNTAGTSYGAQVSFTTSATAPTAAYMATASSASGTPAAGASDTITLTVKNSLGNTDTTFTGAHDVTISGVEAAPDSSYGSFNGAALTGTSQTVSVSFTNGVASPSLVLNKADAQTIGFSIDGVNTAATNSLSITPTAGAVSSMALTQDVTAPASNGGAFAQQPKITLKDTYGNVCTNDSTTQVTVAKSDGGSWTLTGATKMVTATSGVATFSGIGATNDAAVTGAQLKFSSGTLTDVTSTTVKLPAPSPSGGGFSTSGSSSNNGAAVIVNGETKTAGTAQTTTNSSGQTTTTVTVDTSKLENILASQGTGATVTIPITGNSDVATGTLTGAMVKSMETKDATLVVQTHSGTYTLPASEININAVSQQLGTSVALSDIKVTVSISEPSASMTKVIESAAQDGGFTIMVPAVDYTISCTHGSQTVDVSNFNAYVERTIAIPDGVDPTKITTGVVVDPDGTTHHVPTRVTVMNGKYYAVINSLTNSTYFVVWNPIEFSDVSNHWAKDAINDMGSRMVVTGVGNNNYAPDRNMTRGEFATILVRALGLEPGTGASGFGDVASTDWCSGYIKTAASYGIVGGYDNGNFGPKDTITREQAMTMIARAMAITKLSAGLTDGKTSQLLGNFSDGTFASDYAKESIAACLKTGITSGTSATTISPQADITRAEVAVMVERLLQKSNLI